MSSSGARRSLLRTIIDKDLSPIVRVGVLRLGGIRHPPDGGDGIWAEIQTAAEAIGRRNRGLTSGQVPGVDEARRLYRAVGIDPTRTRPSSEALLRRALKGKDLYRVHPLVDLFNLTSLVQLLPVGLYDESKIVGDSVTIQVGRPGWGFDGIRKARVNVEGRLCVADGAGPFGSPTSDSLRTSIEGAVESALAIYFQHRDGDVERLDRTLDLATELSEEHLAATVVERRVIERMCRDEHFERLGR
jgi:DNA/RNA-binding domain of Phe-tRNA-synthetase-like protein